jgi:hypothetical protein
MGTTESLLSEPKGQQGPQVRRAVPPQQQRRRARPAVTATTNLHGIVVGLPNSGKRALLQRLEGKDPFRTTPNEETKQQRIAVPYQAPGNTWGETISLQVEIPTNFELQPDFCIVLINPRHDPKSLKPYVLQLLAMLVQRTLATISICINFRDLEEAAGTPPRLSQRNVQEWIEESQFKTSNIETGVTSMKNCYGLNVLHHFIYQSYLTRKRRILEQQLVEVQQETKQSKTAHQTPSSYKEFLRILEESTAGGAGRRIMSKPRMDKKAERRLNGDPPPRQEEDEVSLKPRAPPQRRTVVPSVTKLVIPKGADAQKALDDFFADDDSDDDVGRISAATKSDDDEDDFYYDEGGTRMGAHDDDSDDERPPRSKPQSKQQKAIPAAVPEAKEKKKKPTSLREKQKRHADKVGVTAPVKSSVPNKAKAALPTKIEKVKRVEPPKKAEIPAPDNHESDGWDNDDDDLDLDDHSEEEATPADMPIDNNTKSTPEAKREESKDNEEKNCSAAESPTVKVPQREPINSPVATPSEAATADEADGWGDDDDDDLDLDDSNDADSDVQKAAFREEATIAPVPDEIEETVPVPDELDDDALESSETITEEHIKEVTPIAGAVDDDTPEDVDMDGDDDEADGWGDDDDDLDVDDESEVVANEVVGSETIQSKDDDDSDDDDDFMNGGSSPAVPTSSKASGDDSDDSDGDDFMIGDTPPQPSPKAPLENNVAQSDEEEEKVASQGEVTAIRDNEDDPEPYVSSTATPSGPSAAVLAAIQVAQQEAHLMLEQQQEEAQKVKKTKKKKKKKDGEKKRKKKSGSIATSTTSEDLEE